MGLREACSRWAREAWRLSAGCIGLAERSALLKASLENCSGAGGGSVEVSVGGLKLSVPVDQLPEAWLNIVHVLCAGDYWLAPGYRPASGWTVVDLGAYLGFYAVYAALLVGRRGRVVAVEPNPWARRFVYENAALNSVDDRVEVDPRAVGRSAGYADLYVPPFWGNSSLLRGYAEESGEVVRVPVRLATLGELLADHGLRSADLVKVDIEGCERAVLADAVRAARRVVVELHPPWAGRELLREVGGRWLVYEMSTGQLVAYRL